MERERSSKEEDTLERSTKKFKEIHPVNEVNTERLSDDRFASYSANSYKDKLVGSIPGAYEQAFGFSTSMDEEDESDVDDDELCEGMAELKVSREEKKSLGHVEWIVSSRMDCVDMGHDFFLIKFELKTYLDKVLKKGSWFVGQQFLAIRQWAPEFKASKASYSSIAVWIRLPELPIEYYNPIMLKNVGEQLVLCCVLIPIRLMVLEVFLQESVSRLTLINL